MRALRETDGIRPLRERTVGHARRCDDVDQSRLGHELEGRIDGDAGVPEDLLPNLFDPFVTTKRNGTGLGLALVAKVIGDHGGVIEFDSQPRRTVFRVFLPMVAQDGSG